MNDFKDKITKSERLYVYSVPLLFLVGFGLFLLRFIFNEEVEFEIAGNSGTLINLFGAIIFGYSLSAECTIIHYLLQAIKEGNTVAKVLLIILFLPALSLCLVLSYIGTIPYWCYSINKIKRIQMDNEGVFSKGKIISLITLLVIDLIIAIIFFVL